MDIVGHKKVEDKTMSLSCYPQVGYLKAANSLQTDNKQRFYKASSLYKVDNWASLKLIFITAILCDL